MLEIKVQKGVRNIWSSDKLRFRKLPVAKPRTQVSFLAQVNVLINRDLYGFTAILLGPAETPF